MIPVDHPRVAMCSAILRDRRRSSSKIQTSMLAYTVTSYFPDICVATMWMIIMSIKIAFLAVIVHT